MDRNTVDILGYGVDTFSFENAIDYIINKHGQIVTINPEMIESANKDSNFRTIINNAEMVVPDGVGIKIALKDSLRRTLFTLLIIIIVTGLIFLIKYFI